MSPALIAILIIVGLFFSGQYFLSIVALLVCLFIQPQGFTESLKVSKTESAPEHGHGDLSIGNTSDANLAPKANLTQIDDAMIAGGAIGITVLLAVVYAQQTTGTWLKSNLSYVTLFAIVGCVAVLLLGVFVRHRERTALRLWKLMRHTTDTRVSTLVNNSRFSRADIRRAVVSINSAGLAHLVLDESSDRLYDGRLSAKVNLTHECEGCGASTELVVDIQQTNGLCCSYCNSPFPTETVNALQNTHRQRVASQNTDSTMKAIRQKADLLSRIPEPTLSLKVLVILILFFWPAAIVYVVRYLSSSRRFRARLIANAEAQGC